MNEQYKPDDEEIKRTEAIRLLRRTLGIIAAALVLAAAILLAMRSGIR